MKRIVVALLFLTVSISAESQTIRITAKPTGLVHGVVDLPIVATAPVERIVVSINGVKFTEAVGRNVTVQIRVGEYIRRMRVRAAGLDAAGNEVGEDETVINDPQPPFRVHLSAPNALPSSGSVVLGANVIAPPSMPVRGVDFFIGETRIGSISAPPFEVAIDPAKFPGAVYARVVAHAATGEEANDVAFFGDRPSSSVDVTLQQVPVSVATGAKPLRAEDLTLFDDGTPRKIEALVPASDQPLYVILLIDYSESMLEELPVVKAAARQFARTLLRPQDRIAIVGFNQKVFWLTGWTNDWNAAADAVDRVKPIGETHLYDSAIEMLFELQQMPGRQALVVLTDGVDQGSTFRLEHLAWYARYAGVPVYPIVKNRILSRWMHFGFGYLESRKLAAIARDTGATYFIIQKEQELPAVYARLAAELRQQFRLLFYSNAGAPDVWHTLRVDTRGGQELRSPRGYFP